MIGRLANMVWYIIGYVMDNERLDKIMIVIMEEIDQHIITK